MIRINKRHVKNIEEQNRKKITDQKDEQKKENQDLGTKTQ